MFPEIAISHEIAVPTYLLTFSLLCSFIILWVSVRAKKFEYDRNTCLDLTLILMIGSLVGARVFHVLYENPEYYSANPLAVLYLWQGGFVYYGGFLGALSFGLLWTHFKKLSFLKYADFFAPIFALSYALGRLGCLLAGCCYGKVCDLPWAMVFHGVEPYLVPRHPTQIYAFVWEALVFIFLIWSEKNPQTHARFNQNGNLFFRWIILHGFGRLIMEAFRDDYRGNFILNLSISSWSSLVLITAGIIFFIRPPKR